MTEPKRKPGRPSNADIAARQAPVMNGDTSRQPEDVMVPVPPAVMEFVPVDEDTRPAGSMSAAFDAAAGAVLTNHEAAQAYAMRNWACQSVDVTRAVRIARAKAALEGQNLPTDGIVWPEIV